MNTNDVEPPSRVRIPSGWGRKVEKLLQDARVKRAWTFESDKNVHVSFETKARIFSMGLAQLMTEKDGETVSVLNIHVGPWSSKSSLSAALEKAGAKVEISMGDWNDLTITSLEGKDGDFTTVQLRR